jgi:hypothetical protein
LNIWICRKSLKFPYPKENFVEHFPMKDIAVKFNFKWFSGFRVEDKMDDNYTTEIKRPSGQIN